MRSLIEPVRSGNSSDNSLPQFVVSFVAAEAGEAGPASAVRECCDHHRSTEHAAGINTPNAERYGRLLTVLQLAPMRIFRMSPG